MRKLFLIAVIFTLSISTFAQRHGRGERIRAFKTAYFTDELDLTPKEAEKFWPVYNAYSDKVYQYKVIDMKKEQTRIREKGGIEALTDKEAQDYLDILIRNEKKLYDAKIKLFKDLRKVLSPKKTLLLYQAERNFNRKLLEEYRRKHSSRHK